MIIPPGLRPLAGTEGTAQPCHKDTKQQGTFVLPKDTLGGAGMQTQALRLSWTFLIPSLSWEEIGQVLLQGDEPASPFPLPGTLIASRFSQKLLLFIRDTHGDGGEEQQHLLGL